MDKERHNNHLAATYLYSHNKYREFINSNFAMFTIGRSLKSQVFYDLDYFCQKLKSLYKIISVEKEAYGHQTIILLQKT